MPDQNARRLLGITSAKVKMWEYRVPEKYHNISITVDPATLFDVVIASLGDLAATINGENYFSQDQLDIYPGHMVLFSLLLGGCNGRGYRICNFCTIRLFC